MSLALTTTHENGYFQRSIPPFFETALYSYNPFGLYCGVGVIDWLSRHVYNVCVTTARKPYQYGLVRAQ